MNDKSAPAAAADFQLTAGEIARFDREGWVGPFRLMSAIDASDLGPELERCHALTKGYTFYPEQIEEGKDYYEGVTWFQSLHSLSPRLAAVGRRPEIVERVAQIIGNDVLLWATICFASEPQYGIHWHTDTEFDHVEGVSVWLGIQNVTPENALKIMPASNSSESSPEDYLGEGRYGMDELADDALALTLAQEDNPGAKIIRPAVHDGEFFIFRGKLWHGSDNNTPDKRIAMGLRYSPPSQKLRIPLRYLPPLQFNPVPPPCVLVKGEDRFGYNRLVNKAPGFAV